MNEKSLKGLVFGKLLGVESRVKGKGRKYRDLGTNPY
jgi:hypothetical protein